MYKDAEEGTQKFAEASYFLGFLYSLNNGGKSVPAEACGNLNKSDSDQDKDSDDSVSDKDPEAVEYGADGEHEQKLNVPNGGHEQKLKQARDAFRFYLTNFDADENRYMEVQNERATVAQYMTGRIAIAKAWQKQIDIVAGDKKKKIDEGVVRSRAIDSLEKIANTLEKFSGKGRDEPEDVEVEKTDDDESDTPRSVVLSELEIHVRRQLIELYRRSLAESKTSGLPKQAAEKKARTFRLLIKSHLNKLLHLVPTSSDPTLEDKQKAVSLSFYVFHELCLNAVVPEGVVSVSPTTSADVSGTVADAAYYGHKYLDLYDSENGKRNITEPHENVTAVLMHVGELCKGGERGSGSTPNASSSVLSTGNVGSAGGALQSAAHEDLQ